ncbi:MAG: hypothetical protein AAGA56_05010, partial [Myxococcota bacterium]
AGAPVPPPRVAFVHRLAPLASRSDQSGEWWSAEDRRFDYPVVVKAGDTAHFARSETPGPFETSRFGPFAQAVVASSAGVVHALGRGARGAIVLSSGQNRGDAFDAFDTAGDDLWAAHSEDNGIRLVQFRGLGRVRETLVDPGHRSCEARPEVISPDTVVLVERSWHDCEPCTECDAPLLEEESTVIIFDVATEEERVFRLPVRVEYASYDASSEQVVVAVDHVGTQEVTWSTATFRRGCALVWFDLQERVVAYVPTPERLAVEATEAGRVLVLLERAERGFRVGKYPSLIRADNAPQARVDLTPIFERTLVIGDGAPANTPLWPSPTTGRWPSRQRIIGRPGESKANHP